MRNFGPDSRINRVAGNFEGIPVILVPDPPDPGSTNIVTHELIEYAFGDRTALIEFIAGSDGVRVRITFKAETTHSIEQQKEGWQAILNRFAKHVESKI